MFDPALSDDTHLLSILSRLRINEALSHGRMTAQQAKDAKVLIRDLTTDPATAYVRILRYLIELAGESWNEPTQVAACYDVRLARRLVLDGTPIPGTLTPIMALDKPLERAYTAQLTLETSMREKLLDLPAIAIHEVRELAFAVPTAGLKPGRYRVQYELLGSGGLPLVTGVRDFFVMPDLAPKLARLVDLKAELDAKPAAAWSMSQLAAIETVAYITETLDRFTREYVGSMDRRVHPMTNRIRRMDLTHYSSEPLDFHKDTARAIDWAESLLHGGDPVAEHRGDMRLAYRSRVDGTLQPFRAFVPEGYAGGREYPLMIVLHGATGDENTYLDRYLDRKTGKNLLKQLAQAHGYIVATPNGRGPFGGYQGKSESDVLAVRERMHALFRIEAGQTYLTGHSMGGAGSWYLGSRHPDLFDAIAPVAGGPVDLDRALALGNKPVFYCLGGRDTLITLAAARPAREKLQSALPALEYREYLGDDHFSVGVTSLPDIFAFCDRCRGSVPRSGS